MSAKSSYDFSIGRVSPCDLDPNDLVDLSNNYSKIRSTITGIRDGVLKAQFAFHTQTTEQRTSELSMMQTKNSQEGIEPETKLIDTLLGGMTYAGSAFPLFPPSPSLLPQSFLFFFFEDDLRVAVRYPWKNERDTNDIQDDACMFHSSQFCVWNSSFCLFSWN